MHLGECLCAHTNKTNNNIPFIKHILYLCLLSQLSCAHHQLYFHFWRLQEETECPGSPEPPLWGTESMWKESQSLGSPPTAHRGVCTDSSSKDKEKDQVLTLFLGRLSIWIVCWHVRVSSCVLIQNYLRSTKASVSLTCALVIHLELRVKTGEEVEG